MKCMLLCGVGIALFVCMALFWAVCRAAARADRTYILPLSNVGEEVEWLLRRIAWRWRWGVIDAASVTVVDLGLDDDTADTVRRLCASLGFDYILVKKP